MNQNRTIFSLMEKMKIIRNEQAVAEFLKALSPRNLSGPVRVGFANAHAFNLCCQDLYFCRDLLECDYVFRDGSGMKILYKMLGREPGLNLNGTDLIPRLLDLHAGGKALLFGTREPFLGRAADAIRSRNVEIVYTLEGFEDDSAYLEAARNHPAPLIILGMGMPRQERVAALLAAGLDYPCLIVCGGAILDFMGGKVSRAPAFLRRAGMEWAYRLALEPRRLFHRYVIGNAVFLARSAALALAERGKAEASAK